MAAGDSKITEFEMQELDDTISCCICTNVYTDAKALPCIHTFCMKCLQDIGLSTNKGPGDEMPCPICRRQFKIPQEGFHALPNNFFIAKLIEVANISGPSVSSTPLCDSCVEENENEGKETPTSDMYCTDCKQKLCEECCRHHRKLKLTKNHKMIPINEQQESDENDTARLAPRFCELHEQKVLDIYCVECKAVECAVCFIDGHRNHEGSHVSKFVDGFRKQIENSIERINHCSSQTQMKKEELIKIKEDLQQKVEKLEYDILDRRDELKQFADTQANSLLQSLCSLRQSKLKEIQMKYGDIDAHLSSLQSYSSYCQKIMAKESASDICRTISDLIVRGIELQQQCQSLIEEEIINFKFCFTKSEFENFLDNDNLIGEIEEECNSRQKKASITERPIAEKLRQELDIEKMKNRTLQASADKLGEKLDCEKTTSETLQVENTNLKQELDTERNAMKTLMRSQEQAIEDCEKTKTDDTVSELKEKLKQERKIWAEEKDRLMNQVQELQNEFSDREQMQVIEQQLEQERKEKEELRKRLEEKEELIKQMQDHRDDVSSEITFEGKTRVDEAPKKLQQGFISPSLTKKQRNEILQKIKSFRFPNVSITTCIFDDGYVEFYFVLGGISSIDESLLVNEIVTCLGRDVSFAERIVVTQLKSKPKGERTSSGPGNPIINMTARSQTTLGAFVSIEGKGDHVFSCGHDKKVGDILSNGNGKRIGTTRAVTFCTEDGQTYDAAVASIDEINYAKSVAYKGGQLHLADTPVDPVKGASVLRFPPQLTGSQATVRHTDYNSFENDVYGCIAIITDNREDFHKPGESGLVVTSLPSAESPETVAPIGMLFFREFVLKTDDGRGYFLSLAIPTTKNLEKLQEDEYCCGNQIKFTRDP